MNIFTEIPTNGGGRRQKHAPVWARQVAALQSRFGAAIEEVRMPESYPTDVPIVYVAKSQLLAVLEFLKTDQECPYSYLSDITATDEQTNPRFEVVYNLYALWNGPRIRVKCRVAEGDDVPSAVKIWKGADWAEREVYDMFGIKFSNHPNLRRILMDYRWEGYPLRKDYPLDGYQVFPDAEAPDPERLK